MESRNQCPKCNGEMKQGIILDHKDYASCVVAKWQAGEPQKSFWRGVRIRTLRSMRSRLIVARDAAIWSRTRNKKRP